MERCHLSGIFMRHLAMALPWALVCVLSLFVLAYGMSQQIKEGIQYTMAVAVQEASLLTAMPPGIGAAPQTVEEIMARLTQNAGDEIRQLLQDPKTRENLTDLLDACSQGQADAPAQ